MAADLDLAHGDQLDQTHHRHNHNFAPVDPATLSDADLVLASALTASTVAPPPPGKHADGRHPSLPSPTLTNPDLILPDHLQRTPSPSLSYQPETPPSPSQYLQSLQHRSAAAQMGALTRNPPAMAPPPMRSAKGGVALDRSGLRSHSSASSRTISPTGSHTHRLSSVDESLEITPRNSRMLEPLPSSPTLNQDGADRLRKWSDASSVHTEDLESLMWSRYEASKGRGKDAMNSSIRSLGSPPDTSVVEDDTESEAWPEEEIDQVSADMMSTALSKRAEMILANAKERLLLMEGNLRGARHSLMVSPSLSLRALKSSSELSNQVAMAKARDKQLYRGLGVSSKHPLQSSPGANGSPGHSRVFSETLIQQSSSPSGALSRASSRGGMRSSSALGALGGTDDGPRQEDFNVASNGMVVRTSRSQDYIRPVNNQPTSPDPSSHRRSDMRSTSGLDPLPEYEPSPLTGRSVWSNRSPPEIKHGSVASSRDGSLQSPRDPHNFYLQSAPGSSPTVSRPTSTASDLKEQMQNLKGRISSLREKAKEDTLRRRSLQSLRTPSPFTAAEFWYQGAEGYKNNGLSQDAGVGERSPLADGIPLELAAGLGQSNTPTLRNKESTTTFQTISTYESQDLYQDALTLQERGPSAMSHNSRSDDRSYSPVSPLSPDEAALASRWHESDEEDNEIPSSPPANDSPKADSVYEEAEQESGLRHEDRPDAFDYSHFFLHSSMGTYQVSDEDDEASSSGSESGGTATPVNGLAEEEQETPDARPIPRDVSPQAAEQPPRPRTAGSNSSPRGFRGSPFRKPHGRSMSSDTVSSVSSFATATEGRHTAMSRAEMSASDGDDEGDSPLDRAVGLGSRIPRVPLSISTQRSSSSHGKQSSLNGTSWVRSPTIASPGVDDYDNEDGSKPHSTRNSGSTTNTVTGFNFSGDAGPAMAFLRLANLHGTDNDSPPDSPLDGLTEKDQALILSLASALSDACEELRGEKGQRYDARVWRRRMDGARRLLRIGVDGRERSASRTRGTTPDVIREHEVV